MITLQTTPIGYFASLLFLEDVWTNGSHCKEPRNVAAIEMKTWTKDHDDYYYVAASTIVREEEARIAAEREWNAQAVYEIRRGV